MQATAEGKTQYVIWKEHRSCGASGQGDRHLDVPGWWAWWGTREHTGGFFLIRESGRVVSARLSTSVQGSFHAGGRLEGDMALVLPGEGHSVPWGHFARPECLPCSEGLLQTCLPSPQRVSTVRDSKWEKPGPCASPTSPGTPRGTPVPSLRLKPPRLGCSLCPASAPRLQGEVWAEAKNPC